MDAIKQAIKLLTEGSAVDGPLAERVAHEIFAGAATPAQIGAFLVALRIRGESAEIIASFARQMRAFATPLPIGDRSELVDIVGTGGDATGTFNISTAAAIVAAGAGAKVAKHGNRAMTGAPGSGSADVLAALGVRIDPTPEVAARCLAGCGITFFFAPAYHGAMKHAGPVRREIGVRSVFNLLGPLANPAGTPRMVVGVGDPGLTELFAQVLVELKSTHVMVVSGADGMDELSLTGPSRVAEARDGGLRSYDIWPEDVGLTRCTMEDLKGGDGAEARAAQVAAILECAPGPCREVVLLNAGAGLVVAGLAADLAEGVAKAAESIDSGAAKQTLAKWVELSNEDSK